jgi:hypothetical protein
MTEHDTELLAAAMFLRWLQTVNGYRSPKLLPRRRWAAVLPLMFTHAIVVGRLFDEVGYDNRWCYSTSEAAFKALDAWDGEGEPEGWHRHPTSGRRRPEGDVTQEYVAP